MFLQEASKLSHSTGIKAPSFFGYIVRYTVPVLLPIFALIWFFFFHG